MTGFIVLMCVMACGVLFVAIIHLLFSEEGAIVLCDGIGEQPEEGIIRIWPQDNRPINDTGMTLGQWEVEESKAWATGVIKHSPWTRAKSIREVEDYWTNFFNHGL